MTERPAPATTEDIVVTARKDTGRFGSITQTSTVPLSSEGPAIKHRELEHAETTIKGSKKLDGATPSNGFSGHVNDGADLTITNVHTGQIGVASEAKIAIHMSGTANDDFFQVYDTDRTRKTGQASVTIQGAGGTDTVAITNVTPDQVIVTGVPGNPHEVTVTAGPNSYTLDDITYLKGRPGATAPAA